MKLKDIIIGKRYTNMFYPGHTWLGIGRRKLFTKDEYIDKHLVLIESNDGKGIGMMAQEDKDAHEGFWDAFQDADAESQTFLYAMGPKQR